LCEASNATRSCEPHLEVRKRKHRNGDNTRQGQINTGKLLDPKAYKDRLINAFIRHDLSFCMVRSKTFRLLLSNNNNDIDDFLPTSDSTISKWVKDAYNDRKEVIKNNYLLKAEGKVNISLDCWKSGGRRIILLSAPTLLPIDIRFLTLFSLSNAMRLRRLAKRSRRL